MTSGGRRIETAPHISGLEGHQEDWVSPLEPQSLGKLPMAVHHRNVNDLKDVFLVGVNWIQGAWSGWGCEFVSPLQSHVLIHCHWREGVKIPCLRHKDQKLEPQIIMTVCLSHPLEWNAFGINDNILRVILGLSHELSSCLTCQLFNDLFFVRGS
jgi:hypothetical protein